ncbi:hypothetical protein ABIF25_005339 [Bradyrhizobium elkanii]|uniref:hypothetical protein n=1 Tax=Bradyrhizobium elkanii TaxID=29448 RepID=UPI0035117B21
MLEEPSLRFRRTCIALLSALVAICCASLIALATTAAPIPFDPAVFHVFFDPQRLAIAAVIALGFALIGISFIFAPLTIGYYVGIYLYAMLLSFLWLNCFSDLDYNHTLAGISAFSSGALFLLPVLFWTRPLSIDFRLSLAAFDKLLVVLICFASVTVLVGARYSFSFVAIDEMAAARENLATPRVLNYLLAMMISGLLPFAFAGLVARRKHMLAALAIVLQFLLYPITLSKLGAICALLVDLSSITHQGRRVSAGRDSIASVAYAGCASRSSLDRRQSRAAILNHQFSYDRCSGRRA